MQQHFFITGVSRGLGKALAEGALERGAKVTGIGRSHGFGDRIEFLQCDLSNPTEIDGLELLPDPNAEVILINNAGILGDIGRISEQASDLEHVMQVNVFAPMQLTRKLYAQLPDKNRFVLVNISSGAANRSIPSWASYCASKAALNRLTENFYLEEVERKVKLRAYAIAPGVVDTGMQAEIRSVLEAQFSNVQNFISMKEEGTLLPAEEAAERIFKILYSNYSGEVFCDVRNV